MSATEGAVPTPPGTTVNSMAAERGRRLLIAALFLLLLALDGWPGGTFTIGIAAFRPAGFSFSALLPASLVAGATMAGAVMGRGFNAAAFLRTGGGGSAPPPFPALFLAFFPVPALPSYERPLRGAAWPRQGGPRGKPPGPPSS